VLNQNYIALLSKKGVKTVKAKEYYLKYKDGLQNNDTFAKSASDMLLEMFHECVDLAKVRHAGSDSALYSILREMNERYNVLSKMFNPPILIPDRFKSMVNRCILPEAKGKW